MAKAYFDCAECGTSVCVVGGSRKEADRWAARYQQQNRVCDECQAKQRAAESAQNAAVNAAANLPALTGSEKQIAWAETLRRETLALFDRIYAVAKSDQDPPANEPNWLIVVDEAQRLRTILNMKNGEALLDAFSVALRRQTSAHWWIDTRAVSMSSRMDALKEEIRQIVMPPPPPAPPPAEQIDAEAEALLKPAAAVSDQIAEISFVGQVVRVAFPEKNETSRLTMRDLGFQWNKIRWERTLSPRAGSPTDRMAEVAHRLLAKGFMVRLYDADARAKALSGQFEAEQTSWIVKLTAGEYTGWLRITWAKDDDFYGPARRITGSRYVDRAVIVPPASVEEAADFAERYGFSMSDAAREVLEARRAQIAAGIIVDEPRGKRRGKRVADEKRPQKIEAPADAEVADDLRDN